jgi:hypothetical protein
MRRFLPLVFALFAAGALAQNHRPPKLEPLPEPPPPPPLPDIAEPAVRIPVQKDDVVEEVRDAGRVVALKVTPKGGGKPYYLIDKSGQGNWMRRDSLEGVTVPMWPIKTFE